MMNQKYFYVSRLHIIIFFDGYYITLFLSHLLQETNIKSTLQVYVMSPARHRYLNTTQHLGKKFPIEIAIMP